MKDRTYRYFAGTPLYPFGYGLSYTRFAFSSLRMPRSVHANQPLTVRAAVRNIGSRTSDEVVELYLRPAPTAKVRQIAPGQPMPRLELAGFERLRALPPHASRVVTFTLAPSQLRLVNAQGERRLQPKTWEIFVGGRQPDIAHPVATRSDVISGLVAVK
jgi:beta-glucosidase